MGAGGCNQFPLPLVASPCYRRIFIERLVGGGGEEEEEEDEGVEGVEGKGAEVENSAPSSAYFPPGFF